MVQHDYLPSRGPGAGCINLHESPVLLVGEPTSVEGEAGLSRLTRVVKDFYP